MEANWDIKILNNHTEKAELLGDGGIAGFSECVAALDRACITFLRSDRKGEKDSNSEFGKHF